jgi:hypothetical protein
MMKLPPISTENLSNQQLIEFSDDNRRSSYRSCDFENDNFDEFKCENSKSSNELLRRNDCENFILSVCLVISGNNLTRVLC